jgi:hypothetical protein
METTDAQNLKQQVPEEKANNPGARVIQNYLSKKKRVIQSQTVTKAHKTES